MVNLDHTYIFDCDGVVLDSNNLKSEAFALALSDEPRNLIADFVAYHKQNGGISRFEKFHHYYTVLNPVDNPEPLIKTALLRYGAYVRQGLLACPLVPGVLEFIQHLYLYNRIFLVSGGAEDELRYVFQERQLDNLFHGIFGSPRNKNDILLSLLETGNLKRPGIYFGDSYLDFQMAQQFGFKFVFVQAYSEWAEGNTLATQFGFQIINNFHQTVDY